jgi:hypothetical protein
MRGAHRSGRRSRPNVAMERLALRVATLQAEMSRILEQFPELSRIALRRVRRPSAARIDSLARADDSRRAGPAPHHAAIRRTVH